MAKGQLARSSYHLNGNTLCAIDIETTGLNYREHEIIQIAIVPLAPNFTKHPDFQPFSMRLRPLNLVGCNAEDIKNNDSLVISRETLAQCLTYGLDPDTARERFEEWFQTLKMPGGKKITPLGSNYLSFDRDFIREWLGGPFNYDNFFRSDVRDTMITALAINDMHEWHSERVPFPRYSLSYLCNCLGVTNPSPHDAYADALTSAEVYRRLMRYKSYHTIV